MSSVAEENRETRHYTNKAGVYSLHGQEYIKAATSRVNPETAAI